MQKLKFTDDLYTGADTIDKQHQALVEKINLLIDHLEAGRSGEVIDTILGEMAKYIFVHFRTEEEFMTRHGFEGLEEHCAIHREFEAKVAQWENAYREGRDDLIGEILDYLCDWFIFHIKGSDRVMVHEVLHGVS